MSANPTRRLSQTASAVTRWSAHHSRDHIVGDPTRDFERPGREGLAMALGAWGGFARNAPLGPSTRPWHDAHNVMRFFMSQGSPPSMNG